MLRDVHSVVQWTVTGMTKWVTGRLVAARILRLETILIYGAEYEGVCVSLNRNRSNH